LKKFTQQLGESSLDDLFFCDVYQLQEFGRSSLGNLTFFAKQSQQKALMKKVIALTGGKARCLIDHMKIDAVCFVPWSVKREQQLMRALEDGWNLDLPLVDVVKLSAS